MKINKIIHGDTFAVLKTLPDECVDLIITSPPYYGLRNYGVEGQLGLEKTLAEYLEKMLLITAELKRVLKNTGQFWLNMGDCYGTGSGAGSRKGSKQATNKGSNYYEDTGRKPPGEQKCLLMQPERLALGMIDQQGWILRNKVKWCKQVLIKKENRTIGSVMPTSVKDRFNESGEELYFFVKNKKYWSDLDAVRLPNQVLGVTDMRASGFVRTRELYPNSKYRQDDQYMPFPKQSNARKSDQPQFKASEEKINNYSSKYGKGSEYEQKYGEPWDRFGENTRKARYNEVTKDYGKKKLIGLADKGKGLNRGMSGTPNFSNELGKNIPTVWQIQSEPHNFQKEHGVDTDHFATFPQALCEIPIKFGCPKGGIVLDPFAGSGTALIVAKKLDRNYLGIELNKKYIEIAEKRLNAIQDKLFSPTSLVTIEK